MALTLLQRFSYSKLDTLVLNGSFGSESVRTSSNVCTIDCLRDIKIPPPEIVAIKEIKTIQIEFCSNLDLAETFLLLADVPNLVKLQLKNCNIKQLPSEIWALYKLRILNLGNEGYGNNNEFTTLPSEFGSLEQLQELNLHDNRHFKCFPPEVEKLEKLKYINLRGLFSLPENIELIPNLERLGLVFSHILPTHIEHLIARPNGLKSVTVGEIYFEMFQKLTERYPDFSVGWEQTSMRGNY